MSAIDNITKLGQKLYFTVNGSTSSATGESLTKFQNNLIMAFNLYLDELDTEAYWNNLRVNNYELATISNTADYSFELPEEYRAPVVNQYKYVKVISSDGTRLASFKLVDPSQVSDDDPTSAISTERATFVGRNIVLSRAPHDTEVGSTLILDVVKYHPRLTTTDDEGISLLPSEQLGVLGMAKNTTLSNVTKVALTPAFTQKYKDELNKQVAINNATNENYDAQYDNYGYVTGLW